MVEANCLSHAAKCTVRSATCTAQSSLDGPGEDCSLDASNGVKQFLSKTVKHMCGRFRCNLGASRRDQPYLENTLAARMSMSGGESDHDNFEK